MTSAEGEGRLTHAEFEALRASGRWAELEDRLRADIRDDPSNHWLLTTVAMACNMQHKHQEALEWSDLATRIMPECPLVRWDRACIYGALGDSEAAMTIWRELAESTAEERGNSPCWESDQWSDSLLADCWYKLAVTYVRAGRAAEARAAASSYRKAVSAGAEPLNTIEELEKALGM